MAGTSFDTSGDARRALRGIVTDPHYGAAALSQPAVISNLLKDLLPDQPREASLLVAAAQADLAGALRGYVNQGLDAGTAARLTAGSFVSNTSHTPEACNWVVNEFALALGMDTAGQHPAAQQPTPQQRTPLSQDTVPGRSYLASPDPTVFEAPPAAQPTFAPLLQPPAAQQAQAPQQAQYAWQQPAAQVPGQQPMWQPPASRSAATRPPALIVAGLIGLAGALFVLLGCILPWIKTGSAPGISIFGGYPGENFSDIFWTAIEPAGVIVACVILSIVLLARGRSAYVAGMLTAFGIQTILLFGYLAFATIAPSTHAAAGPLGVVGGVVLLVAGLVARAAKDTLQVATSGGQAAGAVSPAPR